MHRLNSILFAGLFVFPFAAEAQTTHNLNFVRHNSVAFSNADADRISADGTSVLRIKHTNNDIPCNVVFRRNGNVTATNVTDGTIDSAAELVSLEQVTGDVKIVRAINWCGSTGASIIGCARVPGSSLAMVRFKENLEGILMTHEFGHNQGRSHRTGLNNLMHPSIGTSRKDVNQAECNAMRSPATLVGSPSVGSLEAQISENQDTLDAIRTHYYHGFPVSIGIAIPKSDSGLIIEMLKSDAEVEWWPNALAALGLLGIDSGYDEIKDFMQNFPKEDLSDPQKFRALVTAPIAIGYHVNRTGDKNALNFLIEGANPAKLIENNLLPLTSQKNDADRVVDLDPLSLASTFTAALSVAITEDDAALSALKGLHNRSTGEFGGAVSDAAEQAIYEYQQAKQMGLKIYSEK